MRKTSLIISALLSLSLTAEAENVAIETPNNTLVVDVTNGQRPTFLYYGPKLAKADMANLQSAGGYSRMELYLPYGPVPQAEPAFACRHSDGNMTTELVATGYDVKSDGKGTITTIHLKDPQYSLSVDLHYRAYTDVDMIETWTDIVNNERGTVTLTDFYSGTLPIRRGDVWLSSLYGSWASEARVDEEPLIAGDKVIKNTDGTRNSHTSHAEVMFSLDGKAKENSGDVIGAALCYGGNYELKVITDDSEYHRFLAGINPENSFYNLKKGETFTTPPLALTYSQEGLSGASRNFHKWGRVYRLAHGNELRRILLNSWEGVYFNINEENMDQMMADIADMGGELFVMDDGWFGSKYQRNTDNAALGDWVVDTRKLPNGLENLVNDAKKHGIKFGIWIEPEATNTTSELYEKHPDWVIKAPKRDISCGRGGTQLVLDMSNPKVQDHVFSLVDNLLSKYPDIAYIKWDANMPIQSAGSQYLSMDEQSHLYIDYHRGLEKTLKRIRAK